MTTPTLEEVEEQILADLAEMTPEEWWDNMMEADKASRELDKLPDPWEERLRDESASRATRRPMRLDG